MMDPVSVCQYVSTTAAFPRPTLVLYQTQASGAIFPKLVSYYYELENS
jgi:hypothetical protein